MVMFLSVILALLVGVGIGYILKKPKVNRFDDREEAKEVNLAKLRQWIKDQNQVSNRQVEQQLGVSDATATRYLDALEKEGLIEQQGISGPSITYNIKKP